MVFIINSELLYNQNGYYLISFIIQRYITETL